jgi:filamentous hemagglutinin family protein
MSDKNPSRKAEFRLSTPVRLGVAAVAACFIAGPVLSNPVNPTVVNGTATFNQTGNVLTVTNSNGAIINWQQFNIGAGETTHFAQASASSSVLNRVLANDPSLIYGTLSSNGRVWLVNPAGILVGAGGRVDVAGFVASTLNISNADFLAGRNLFVNDGTAQNVINQGEIRTPSGGSVYLVGSNVTNEGLIHTPAGETILAAGQTVSLIDSATPGVKVDITGAAGNATNLGTITADAGRIGIAGVIVRNSGLLNASSVVNEGGRIFLKATGDTLVEGGRLDATSVGGKGGQVDVLGDRVAVMNDAEIDVSGTAGGGYIRVGGDYQGKNSEIQNASITYLGKDAVLRADATEVGAGGTVIVWADDTARAYGSIVARGGAKRVATADLSSGLTTSIRT